MQMIRTVPKGVLFGFLLAFALAFAEPTCANQMTLEDLIREVKVALLKVQQDDESRSLPKLETAVLELNTVQVMKANGKVSFYVVEIGGDVSSQITHTVTLTLTPPSAKASSDVASTRLAEALAESILAGAKAIVAAKKGSPPLHARELKVAIKFALIREGGGGLKVSFPPFAIGAGGSISASAIQSITVTYK
jgi:hypothetical protein